MEPKVADYLFWSDCPDHGVEAADGLAYTNIADELGRVDTELGVVENSDCNKEGTDH